MSNAIKTIVLFCCGLGVTMAVIALGSHASMASATEIARLPADRWFVSVNDKTNTAAQERMAHESEKARAREVIDVIAGFREAERIAEEQAQQEAEAAIDYGYLNCSYAETAHGYAPSDGLTPDGGVNYHDGRRETYYSSNVSYHQRTPEWTLDEEGFYRDEKGRYVVAASDKAQGETFEGSKGECVVLDTGCAPGVTDYYVGW